MQLTVEDLCKKLRPVLGKKIDMLYLKYALTEKKEAKFEIEQLLNALYQKHLNESLLNEAVFLEPPPNEIINGDYSLANISYAKKEIYPFGLRESDWQRHVCISGMSGSGKTTFAFQILQNFIKKNKPFLALDWKKSFRPLMLIDESILCFTVGNKKVSNLFKININEPPGNIDPKEWLNILCDIIIECFSASYGVHKLLSETLNQAFVDFGVYEGSENYPTWYQIRDKLEEKSQKARGRTRESEWLISALRIAYVLTFGNFGEAINTKTRNSFKIEDLMDKKVLFELDALSNIEKKFFCWYLLTYIYKMKKANGAICDEFKNAILVDEAHNIFLKDRPHFINESVTDVIYREIREYGVSLICLDQHISKLSDTVAGNSACNIAFQQMLPQDIECVAGIMQLKDRKNYFSMLPVGTAIVRLTERYYQPFLIKAPFTELKKKIVGDAFVAERMNFLITKLKKEDLKRDMKDMESIFRESGVKDISEEFLKKQIELKRNEELLRKPIMNHLQAYLVKYIKEQLVLGFDLDVIKGHLLKYGYNRADIYRAISHIKEPNTLYSLNKQQQKFLEFVQEYPYLGTAEVYKLLCLSGRLGNKIKNELVDIGLIEVKEEKNSDGRKKILQISEIARKTLEKAE